MRIISIANFKGGTGKTVTAVNLAALLAAANRRTLLVDADPQHNASDFYGGGSPDELGLYEVLTGQGAELWYDNVRPVGRECLELLPGSMDLLRLDLAAMAAGGGEFVRRWADFLDAAAADNALDYVLIDCPPSFSAASVAALSCADLVILPTRVDAFSAAGVSELISQVRSLGRLPGGTTPETRVLITMAERTNLHQQGAEALRRSGLLVFDTEIRATVKVGESTFARQPLMDYAPRCTAAYDYRDVANQIMEEAMRRG